jgi:hypothetical protein
MKFIELDSFEDASKYFIQDTEFYRKLIPNDCDYAELLNYLGPETNLHQEGVVSYALSGYIFVANPILVDGLFNLIEKNGLLHFDNHRCEGRLANILFHLPVAVAKTYKSGFWPDTDIIKAGLVEVVQRFEQNKRTTVHLSHISDLIDSIFAAYLAQDLESVEKLLAIRKNSKTFPFMDSLAREMFKCASYQVIDGRKIIRFSDNVVKENFIRLLDAHRDWTRNRFMKIFPDEYCCFLAHPFLASYCLAWIFLQSFAQEPVFNISKQDMRLILTDTQA